jgi:hypothetical protein
MHDPEPLRPPGLGRRDFLQAGGLAAAASSLLQGGAVVAALTRNAHATGLDLVRESLNGLIAFVVPGPDTYSVAQGMSTPEPGGVDAGVMEVLIRTLDATAPFVPQFSATVVAILENLANAVHPSPPGPFASVFARLSFVEKAVVFRIMDGTESLASLGGVLPAFVAYLCYSDAGAFDPATRQLTGQPVGWTICNYSGTADGRDELRGYLGQRRRASGAGHA